jgi:hypothetical protein
MPGTFVADSAAKVPTVPTATGPLGPFPHQAQEKSQTSSVSPMRWKFSFPAKATFLRWPGGLLLSQGKSAASIIAWLESLSVANPDPEQVANMLFEAALVPFGRLRGDWPDMWPDVRPGLLDFLHAFEQQIGAAGLASAVELRLASRVAHYSTASLLS